MLSNLSLFLQVIACGLSWNMVPEDVEDASHEAAVSASYVRCTRRFSPGACGAPAAAVWTFVFAAQNCTERLGCPRQPTANRFSSYARCVRRCQSLVDLYTHILATDANQTFYLRNDTQRNESRREGGDIIPPLCIPLYHRVYHSEDTDLEEFDKSEDKSDYISSNNDIFAPNFDEDNDFNEMRTLEEAIGNQ